MERNKLLTWCCVVIIFMILINVFTGIYKLVEDIRFYKKNIFGRRCSDEGFVISDRNETCSRQQMVGVLLKLGGIPLAVKKHTAVYIPKSNRCYWQLGDESDTCLFTPFISPLLTGIASLHGDISRSCAERFSLENSSKYDTENKKYTDKELCQYALKWNLRQVFVIDSASVGIIVRLIKCGL